MKNIATLMTLEKQEDFPVAALFQTVSNSGSGHNISKMQLWKLIMINIQLWIDIVISTTVNVGPVSIPFVF